jgi:magnesium transporter
MALQKIFEQITQNIQEIVDQSTPLGISLWQEIQKMHPADSAQLLSYLTREEAMQLFLMLPQSLKLHVFSELSLTLKIYCLSLVNDHDRSLLLSNLPIDELTDLLDELSDEELKKYLLLLHKQDREQVLSLLKFKADSAGGMMDTNVLSLLQELTVEKSIHILQRLQPNRDLHQQIFVVNHHNQLEGHINLEDLVLKHPQTKLASILRPNALIAHVEEDREEIAKKMMHYNLMTIPVVDSHGIFLGVIPSDTLVEIIEEEASEDIYRMAALTPIKHTYFETSFFKLLYQRSSILMLLLIIQSLSSIIIRHYEVMLSGFLMFFITMLTSTGGNTSSQTSALVIQGLATGEIDDTTMGRFIRRELIMSLMIALVLGAFSFFRIYFVYGNMLGSLVVSMSLALIVLVSVILGSCMPIILKKLKLDPAHSAGPLLATLMDVVGLLIYCSISQLFFIAK